MQFSLFRTPPMPRRRSPICGESVSSKTVNVHDLIPELQPYATALFSLEDQAGIRWQLTSTLRTFSQQAQLYRQFLAGNRAYPAAPPGTSAHEFGYAFDMITAEQTDVLDLGAVWRSWGGRWNENDNIHFEYPGFQVPRFRHGAKYDPYAERFVPCVAVAVSPVASIAEAVSPSAKESPIVHYAAHPLEAARYVLEEWTDPAIAWWVNLLSGRS